MRRVLAAREAEFVKFQPRRRSLLVLGGRVVAVLALSTLQRNNLSRHSLFLFVYLADGTAKPCPRPGAEISAAKPPR